MRICSIVRRELPKTLVWRFGNLSWIQQSREFGSKIEVQADKDFALARQWFQNFLKSSILKDIGEVSYSRSSGPGGQNVNKVNSKAQLRVPIDRLLPLVPAVLHDGIRGSNYYAAKSSSLLIQSDDSRKQIANKDTCYEKLNELLVNVYKQTVPGETSLEQKEKVKKLKAVENEARIKSKKLNSSKKASRSKSTGE